MNKKNIILILFIILVNFTFGEENKIKVGLGYKGRSYDPQKHTDSSTLAITKQIYNNLFYLDENIQIKPELAESYEIDKNNNIVIKLKKGIKFHDGEELNADIVIESLKRNLSIPITKVLVEPIESVKKIDDYTVLIEQKYNPQIVLHNLTHSSLAIVKKNKDEKTKSKISLVGTGAFKLKEWGIGEKVVLETFKDYYKGKPSIDGVTFVTIPETSNRYIALETEEIDIGYDISAVDVKYFRDGGDLNLITETSYGTDFLSLNTKKAPLNDKNLREAIKLALDKKAINEIVFEGTSEIANSILTPKTFGYDKNLKDIKRDVEKGKELVKKYGKPVNIDLWIYEDPSKYQMAQVIQANLQEIGINVEIKTLELSSFLQLSAQGQHNSLIGLWYASTGDGDYGMYPLLHSSSVGAVGNRSFFTNKEMDRVLEEGRKNSNKLNREKSYIEAQKIIDEENPIIPIVYKMYNVGLNKKIQNFEFNPNGNHKLENIVIKN